MNNDHAQKDTYEYWDLEFCSFKKLIGTSTREREKAQEQETRRKKVSTAN